MTFSKWLWRAARRWLVAQVLYVVNCQILERARVPVNLGEGGACARSPYGFNRQPRASSALAAAKAMSATSAVTTSDSHSGDSWKPVEPALVASTR